MIVMSILKRKIYHYNCVLTKKEKLCDCEENEDCFECKNKKKCIRSVFGNVFDMILHYLEFHFMEENKILGVINLSKKVFKKKKKNDLEKIPDMDYFAFFKDEHKSILDFMNRDCVNFENYKKENIKKEINFVNNKLLSNLNILDKQKDFIPPKNLNSRSKRMFVNTFSVKKKKIKKITKSKKESFINTYEFFNL